MQVRQSVKAFHSPVFSSYLMATESLCYIESDHVSEHYKKKKSS